MRHLFDRIAIASGVRTPITAPIDCHSVTLEQEDTTNAAKLWDAAAGGVYKTLAPGAERIFQSLEARRGYEKDDVICYVEAVAGTGPLALHFAS